MGTTLFDKLYEASDKAIKKMQKPLVRKKIKRAMESAWDDAEDRKIKAEESLANNRKNFDTFDVNEILKAKKELTKCDEAQTELKKEYREMFDEEMKN